MAKEKNFGKLNVENLKKTVEYLKTIDKEKFNMAVYRPSQEMFQEKYVAECNTVGCILGHSTILAPDLFELAQRISNNPFSEFSKMFFGKLNFAHWDWLFSGKWAETDPTLERSIKRLESVIENGFPEYSDIEYMMNGEQLLNY